MTLDLARLAGDIPALASQLAEATTRRNERLARAWERLARTPSATLAEKIAASEGGFDWPLAGLFEAPALTRAAGTAPGDYQALAADGSQIEFDRHQPAPCFLINLGAALLAYGAHPGAQFWNQPHLHLAESSPRRGQPDLSDPALLRLQRAGAEAQFLAQHAAELNPSRPTLALLDGSLVLWGLEGRRVAEGWRRSLLEGYLRALGELRALSLASPSRAFGLAAYISHPRSSEVMGVVRLAACPYPVARCGTYCGQSSPAPCDEVSGLLDRDLFAHILAPGERSALFLIRTPLVQDHYGEHEVAFFYLRLSAAGGEMARVEVPRWVAQDEARLELAHSLVWDQCRRGQGYPVAVSEAHEQAVVTAADRDAFWLLMERALVERRLSTSSSAKSLSKRTRWI